MIVCPWEKENLNRNVCKLYFGDKEDFSETKILELEKLYDYIISKVGIKQVPIYKQLSENGFYFLETQLSISYKHSECTMGRLASYFRPKVKLYPCRDNKEVQAILSKIKENLFSTDRIALDPHYNIQTANLRYCNWITNTINDNGFTLFKIMVGSLEIGFCYFNDVGPTTNYILGGLYKEYQGKGFGVVEPLASIIHMESRNLDKVFTNVSSNNLKVLQCYLECGFTIEEVNYVFAKMLR